MRNMRASRTSNSIRNFTVVFFEQVVYNIISFICRTIFIVTLGKTYLGYSGLFSDILTLLSLAELGVGTAITYFMYKPTADEDYEKVVAYLNFYKKIYRCIGTIIGIIGICLTPFINIFISGVDNIENLNIIYLLYLFNTTVSYFFSYNRSILITQQKNYIISIIYMITVFLQNIFQIISLLLFKNYIVYLIIQIVFTFLNNLMIYIYVEKSFSFLKQYKNAKLNKKEKNKLFENIKAMFANKLSSAVVTSTDNVLISKFVSTVVLGIYSNYTLFVNMFRTIITKIFDSIVGSVGNLVATESKKKSLDIFYNILFGNFWLVSYCCVMLFVFINPFIKLWIGADYLLSGTIIIFICINLYMRLMRNTLLSFLDTYGLFKELKIKSVLEALINLFVSLLFVLQFKMGVIGVLLGTFISNLMTNFWYEPYILFKKRFEDKIIIYFYNIFKYLFISILMATIMYFININLRECENIFMLVIRVIVFSIVLNVVYYIIFRKNNCLIFYCNCFSKLKKRWIRK